MEGEDGSGDRILAAEADQADQDNVGSPSLRVVFYPVKRLEGRNLAALKDFK